MADVISTTDRRPTLRPRASDQRTIEQTFATEVGERPPPTAFALALAEFTGQSVAHCVRQPFRPRPTRVAASSQKPPATPQQQRKTPFRESPGAGWLCFGQNRYADLGTIRPITRSGDAHQLPQADGANGEHPPFALKAGKPPPGPPCLFLMLTPACPEINRALRRLIPKLIIYPLVPMQTLRKKSAEPPWTFEFIARWSDRTGSSSRWTY